MALGVGASTRLHPGVRKGPSLLSLLSLVPHPALCRAVPAVPAAATGPSHPGAGTDMSHVVVALWPSPPGKAPAVPTATGER